MNERTMMCTELPSLANPKTVMLARLIRERIASHPSAVLVVGCGSGIEAAVLARDLNARVTGIDISTNFDPVAAEAADLRYGDATQMDFDDASFDLVFSFHALEHIPNHRKALSEMHRVLRMGGGWLSGAPNRDRLIGYLGSRDASLAEKIRWNLDDLRAKLSGRFRNEFGAHAGFSSEELDGELSSVFSAVQEVTLDYYRLVYQRHQTLVEAISRLGMGRWLFPAVYFLGSK